MNAGVGRLLVEPASGRSGDTVIDAGQALALSGMNISKRGGETVGKQRTDTRSILFLHQNFPGQFVHLAQALRFLGHKCIALVPSTNRRPRVIPTVSYDFVAGDGSPSNAGSHYAECLARGSAAARAMLRLKADGFTPDVVIGHSGWGETLFVRDVWPRARIIAHAEFYYAEHGADVGFDPEFSTERDLDSAITLRSRNAAMLQALVDADRVIAPTSWQASRFPADIQRKMEIIHEGVNTAVARPSPHATVRLGRDKLTLRPGDEVVTFVSRNLEPYRGYHTFMRALPRILAARPNARVVIVGGDKVSYGPKIKGVSWKTRFLKEVITQLDISRIHFVNVVPHDVFIQLMQVSAAHVYLTYPFVLSWSMLEAMSCGAPVIGSRTAPVEEIIQPGRNGVLVDFFDTRGLADAVINVLSRPRDFLDIRARARETILSRFDLANICLPRWVGVATEQALVEKPV